MSSESKFTPGPWQWVNRDSGGVMLQTPDRGRLVVMSFGRKGMQSAEPRFAIMDDDQPRGRRGGILMSMSELMGRGKNELPPDAALIAASPKLYESLAAIAGRPRHRGTLLLDAEDFAAIESALASARGEG